MKALMTKEDIIRNATHTRHQTQTAAFAATLIGIPAISLCCWCAEHIEGDFHRLPQGGECSKCNVTGQDVGILFTK